PESRHRQDPHVILAQSNYRQSCRQWPCRPRLAWVQFGSASAALQPVMKSSLLSRAFDRDRRLPIAGIPIQLSTSLRFYRISFGHPVRMEIFRQVEHSEMLETQFL